MYINYLKMTYLAKYLNLQITNLFRKVNNYTDKHSLQVDLDKLVKWSDSFTLVLIHKCLNLICSRLVTADLLEMPLRVSASG